jgi:hypothetical protein
MSKNRAARLLLPGVLLIVALGACSNRSGSSAAAAPDPEGASPAGDIPDSQVFVPLASAQGGYALTVPEGWALTASGADVELTFHYDGLSVSLSSAPKQPDVNGLRALQAQKLKAAGENAVIDSVREVSMAGGPAVLMVYESDSQPNPVTHKQVRLENDCCFFYRGGRLAELRMWAPKWADNVDQWQRIANSFRWQ